MIGVIDRALESLLRARLPLPEDVGDVSFDVPDREWSARLSRVTVNVYLFDVGPSARPAGPADKRVRPDGRVEVRAQLPVVRLGYVVSAWAGRTRDEHELLSEVLTTLVTHQAIPEEYLPPAFPGVVQLAPAPRDGRRDLWSGLDARPKPAIEVEVTVPLGPQPWAAAAPSVERIAALVAPRPAPPREPPPREALSREAPPGAPTSVRRAPDGRLERVVVAVDRPVRE